MGTEARVGEAQEHEREHDEHAHPGAKTYLLVAAVLTIITAVEVAIFYIPALESVLVPVLLALSAGKFVLVVLFYMHLKFDSKIFSTVFMAPFVLAVLLVISLVLLFKVLPTVDPTQILPR